LGFNAIPDLDASEEIDDSLKDTATSPLKTTDVAMREGDALTNGAKRSLDMGELEGTNPHSGHEGNINVDVLPMDVTTPPLKNNREIPAIGGIGTGIGTEKERTKRTKKDGANSNSSKGSADSRGGSVRSQ
jgi:hypothetical protein